MGEKLIQEIWVKPVSEGKEEGEGASSSSFDLIPKKAEAEDTLTFKEQEINKIFPFNIQLGS